MKMPPQFVVPVKGMKRPKRDNPIIGSSLEGRATYYENEGALRHSYKKCRWNTFPIYFIQSRDGEMHLISEPLFDGASVVESLQPYFHDKKKRQVIRFDLPIKNSLVEFYPNNDAGILHFIGMHHPNKNVGLFALNKCPHLAPLLDLDPNNPDHATAQKLCEDLLHRH